MMVTRNESGAAELETLRSNYLHLTLPLVRRSKGWPAMFPRTLCFLVAVLLCVNCSAQVEWKELDERGGCLLQQVQKPFTNTSTSDLARRSIA